MYKSNRNDLFLEPLLLKREVNSRFIPLFLSQKNKRLSVVDTKQQPNGTHPTNIGVAQPTLSENRLQNKTLPSKEIATTGLSPEKKNNPLVLLNLEGNSLLPETIDANNNIEPKKPNLLGESKSEKTCPSIAIESLNASNLNTDNNTKDPIALLKKESPLSNTSVVSNDCFEIIEPTNHIESKEQNLLAESGLKESCPSISSEAFHTCPVMSNLHLEHYQLIKYTENIIKKQKKVKKLIESIEILPLIDILRDNIIENVTDKVETQSITVLKKIEVLKKKLAVIKNYYENDTSTQPYKEFQNLIQSVVNELDSLLRVVFTTHPSIDARTKIVDNAIENCKEIFYENISYLNKLLFNDCKNELYIPISQLNEIRNFGTKTIVMLIAMRKNIKTVDNMLIFIKDIITPNLIYISLMQDIDILQKTIQSQSRTDKIKSMNLIEYMIFNLKLEEQKIKSIKNRCTDCIRQYINNSTTIKQLLQEAINIEGQVKKEILSLTEGIIQKAEQKKERLKELCPFGYDEV
ncbi:hypothetical protein ACRRVB_02015 [Candidatus Cardinium hertigii]|uniref:hypothetical protein n=1 Tax=Candidatus Cardinium hertigii TaxID=247481 RepID=UPI003D7D1E95